MIVFPCSRRPTTLHHHHWSSKREALFLTFSTFQVSNLISEASLKLSSFVKTCQQWLSKYFTCVFTTKNKKISAHTEHYYWKNMIHVFSNETSASFARRRPGASLSSWHSFSSADVARKLIFASVIFFSPAKPLGFQTKLSSSQKKGNWIWLLNNSVALLQVLSHKSHCCSLFTWLTCNVLQRRLK